MQVQILPVTPFTSYKYNMNKPTANYRMSKPTKTMLALGKFRDAHDRGQWKRAMIDAELEANKKIAPGKEKE